MYSIDDLNKAIVNYNRLLRDHPQIASNVTVNASVLPVIENHLREIFNESEKQLEAVISLQRRIAKDNAET